MTLKRSLKVIQTGTIRKIGCGFLFAFHSNMAVSLTVYEIFSFKDCSRSLKMAPFDIWSDSLRVISYLLTSWSLKAASS